CECVSPYVNAAPEGAVPGSVCTIDYCSDVHYCPLNSTCKNVGDQAKCDCNAGFVDLRKSDRLSEAGLGDAICMRHTDVNECLLGLHNCSAAAICTDLKYGYECKCPDGYTDGNPSEPGGYVQRCCAVCATATVTVFTTVSPTTSPAHVSTAILDSSASIKPYKSARCRIGGPVTFEGEPPEYITYTFLLSVTKLSNANANHTASSAFDAPHQPPPPHRAKCDCNAGFVDLRKSDRLSEAGLGDAICMRHTDVNECLLGLHNCSAAAICTDLKYGYECKCPDGYTDGNPSEPGRVCAALLCGLCNGHGDCIHDSVTNNVTCACVDGYSGQFC
ncbi:calcium binding EGF domain protein, partial [Ostertagia ostertagi]